MSVDIEKTIDIDKVLESKLGAKMRWIPGFAVRWLKRIVHEDEVNRFLWESRDKTGTEWLEWRGGRICPLKTTGASTPLCPIILSEARMVWLSVPSSAGIMMGVSVTLSTTCYSSCPVCALFA